MDFFDGERTVDDFVNGPFWWERIRGPASPTNCIGQNLDSRRTGIIIRVSAWTLNDLAFLGMQEDVEEEAV